MSEIAMASIAASLLTLGATLILVHTQPRLAIRWARLPAKISLPLLAVVLSAGGLLVLAFDAAQPVTSSASQHLRSQMAARVSDAPQAASQDGDDGSARERAAAQLREYAARISEKKQSIVALGDTGPAAEATTSLPDVDTMLARLVERLKSSPDDVKGWTTLGWAYANTGKYSESLAAYEKAATLDPGNGELQAAIAGVRANASGDNASAGENRDHPVSAALAAPNVDAATGPPEQMPAIRGMVDRLAEKLESSPRDADGWLRLMKSRTVLGETDRARDALRKALAAFAGDAAERQRISQGARDLGLKAYAD